jgi:hypothetical protein
VFLHLLGELCVLFRVNHVQTIGHHGYRPASRFDGSPVGDAVDPPGQAADDADTALSQAGGQR